MFAFGIVTVTAIIGSMVTNPASAHGGGSPVHVFGDEEIVASAIEGNSFATTRTFSANLTLLDQLNAIKADFSTDDLDFGYRDRGEMYLRTYETTGSKAAVVQGNIATFSGILGGTGYLANYYLADQSETGEATYQYRKNPDPVVMDIYELSQFVAKDYLDAVIADVTTGNDGNLDIKKGLELSEDTWVQKGLGNQFPGTTMLVAINQVLVKRNFLLAIVSTIVTSPPDAFRSAVFGTAGIMLFGKSVQDFSQGPCGPPLPYCYATLNGPDADVGGLVSAQRYVLKYNPNSGGGDLPNGDRNGDGVLNYEDGTVVMIQTDAAGLESGLSYELWKEFVEFELGYLNFFVGGIDSVAIPEVNITFDWDLYRNWKLMRDF